MIQFNLLPDVKLEYIKAQRLKRAVVLLSVIVAGGTLTLFVLLFLGVAVIQKQHMNNLSKDIEKKSSEIRSIPDIDKILTVQNQLKALPALHAEKPVATRLFNYLELVTPQKVVITGVKADFDANTMTVTGSTDTLVSVNTFVDTVKFTKYTLSTSPKESKEAFSKVVLTQFSRTDKGATFQVDLAYDPTIFNNLPSDENGDAPDVTLQVPQLETTRSATERPGASPFTESGQ